MKKIVSKSLLAVFFIAFIGVFIQIPVSAAAKKTIKITAENITITATEKNKAIGAITNPSGAKLTYTSSNKKIAVVDSKGRVTGKAAGTAEITIKAQKSKYKTAVKKIKVSVKRADQKITVKSSKKKLAAGNSFSLGASAKTSLKYTSSDPSVLTVSDSGKVTGLMAGASADITITAAKTKVYNSASLKLTIKVTPRTSSQVTSSSGSWITVETPSGTRKYHKYYTYGIKGDTYYGGFGCVVDAVSVAASSFGCDYSPVDIHTASKSKKYSENYALVKLGATKRVTNAAIGLPLASQILTDMGIPNKRVSVFQKETAIKEITEHLKTGKPVIVKAHNRNVNGIQVANGHHALVIFGIDSNGNGIFYDTSTGRLNYAHANGTTIKMSIRTFVNNHMDSATGDYSSLYVVSKASAGGYILVG